MHPVVNGSSPHVHSHLWENWWAGSFFHMDKLFPTDSLASLIPALIPAPIPVLIKAPVGDYQPDLHLELELANHGHNVVAGIDEAGRGPLAGPVVAAAVILDRMMCPMA